jgi:hypothetical protein
LKRVTKEFTVKKVFISHPVAGAVEANLEKSLKWVRLALYENVVPFAPYIPYCGALDDDEDQGRFLGVRAGLEILILCDQLWVCGNNITPGMAEEIYRAQSYKIPVIYRDDDEIREVSLPVGAFVPRRRSLRLSTGDSNGKQGTD